MPSMTTAPVWITGRICFRHTSSVTAVPECPTSREISSSGNPRSVNRHEAVPELPRRPLVGVDTVDVLERSAEGTERSPRRAACPWPREDKPVFLPLFTSGEPVPTLVLELLPECLNAARRKGQRAPGFPGLGVLAVPDRAPHRDVRRLRRVDGRLALEKDVVPGQRPSSSVRAPVSSATMMYACIVVPSAPFSTASA